MNVQDNFLKDVISGLSSRPKKLSPKYLLDENGERLFHYIKSQPEYYLACAEQEIMQTYSREILSFIKVTGSLCIIEPAAGDGFQSKIFLNSVLNQEYDTVYNPVDISPKVLTSLCNSLVKSYPHLKCEPIVADYFNLTEKIPADGNKKLMLFMGSNLGSFNEEESILAMQKLTSEINSGDYLLLGVDMVKDPGRILAAYHDAKGITAEFNFNLLLRINMELKGNFNIHNFQYYPVYNPLLQQAESYLISKTDHDVSVTGKTFHFAAWEPVLMGISRKFTSYKIEQLAYLSGFTILENFYDMHKDFCCSLWEKI